MLSVIWHCPDLFYQIAWPYSSSCVFQFLILQIILYIPMLDKQDGAMVIPKALVFKNKTKGSAFIGYGQLLL